MKMICPNHKDCNYEHKSNIPGCHCVEHEKNPICSEYLEEGNCPKCVPVKDE
jgi:hypothetical protein